MRSGLGILLKYESRQWASLVLVLTVGVSYLVFTPGGLTPWSTNAINWGGITALVDGLVVAYPIVAGVGAWLGSREFRLNMHELVIGVRRFGIGQHTPAIANGAIWLSLALGAMFALWALPRESGIAWGVFPWAVVVVTGLSLLAFFLLGYAIGVLAPMRFVPLVTAGGAFLIVLILSTISLSGAGSGTTGISPTDVARLIYPQPFVAPSSEVALASSAWFVALSVLALIAIATRHRPSRLRYGGVAAATILVALAGWAAFTTAEDVAATDRPLAAFTPVCETVDGVETCTHPINSDQVGQDAEAHATLVSPLASLADPPSLFISRMMLQDATHQSDDAVPYTDNATPFTLTQTALVLVGFDSEPGAGPSGPTAAQLAVACMLVQNTGGNCDITGGGIAEGAAIMSEPIDPSESDPDSVMEEREQLLIDLERDISDRADALAVLAPEEQSAWLAEHWDDLQAGDLSLDDLPQE